MVTVTVYSVSADISAEVTLTMTVFEPDTQVAGVPFSIAAPFTVMPTVLVESSGVAVILFVAFEVVAV